MNWFRLPEEMLSRKDEIERGKKSLHRMHFSLGKAQLGSPLEE